MAAILTPEELAARLKVHKSWVYDQIRSRNQNPLPRLNMGHYLRFDWAKVVEWLTQAPEKTSAKKRLRK
jgi:excisionase family DNA binding protein